MSEKITAKAWLEGGIAVYTKQLNKFGESFAENPALALGRSDDTFKIAAKLHMNQRVLQYVTDGHSIKVIIAELDKEILFKAENPISSTSQPSNLMERYILSATAELMRELKMIGDHLMDI